MSQSKHEHPSDCWQEPIHAGISAPSSKLERRVTVRNEARSSNTVLTDLQVYETHGCPGANTEKPIFVKRKAMILINRGLGVADTKRPDKADGGTEI